MRRPPGHLLLDGLAWGLGRTPLPAASLLSWELAWLWWTLLPVRREVAEENLRLALPGLSRRQRARVLRRMFHDVALGYVELLHFLRRPELRAGMVRIEGAGPLLERLRRGQGNLVLGNHSGSWDLVLLALGAHRELRTACVVLPPAQAWARDFIEGARRALDVELLPPRGARERIYELLAGGHTVLVPLDQRHRGGLDVPFFGRPALTSASLAAFSRRAGVPVFFLWQWREGTGRHVARFSGPFPEDWSDDREADLRRATRRYNEALEAAIRERPHGWFWLHRRWAR